MDFNKNNLHVMGYSIPVDKVLSLEELNNHLYSLPTQPDAIPYITSYYSERWGFCLNENDRKKLKKGKYRVYIDSELFNGNLTYGELFLKGESEKEIFLSTYICHPSMANNELSGPTVTTYIAKWILGLKNRKYSYRIIFIPETIGSIAYLSKHLDVMKKNIIAGFNLTCVGDNNVYSYMPSRNGQTLADKVILNVLNKMKLEYKSFSFLERRSDERQYCSVHVDLPLCSLMRSKYDEYPEYHTSLDDLNFISPEGLLGAYSVYIKAIELLEKNEKYLSTTICEPQLGERGLYPNISTKDSYKKINKMMIFLAFCDGKKDLIEISNHIDIPAWELYEFIELFLVHKLIKKI